MKIRHYQDQNKGEFYMMSEELKAAFMTYSKAGEDKIIIDHTFVDEAFKGQGLGYQLLEVAVKYARDSHFKILPLCPFAKAAFTKRPEYQDVLL